MRLALPTYNPAKECKSCSVRDESVVSGYILSFQVADQLMKRFPGTWKMELNLLTLQLKELQDPLQFDLTSGSLRYGSLVTQLMARYSPTKSISSLTDEIVRDLGFPEMTNHSADQDPSFQLILKLVEIFHARCGLHILPVASDEEELWELRLCQEGPQGWLSRNGVAQNRFGETVDLKQWSALRPEKLATHLFGFQRFCRHYPNPQSLTVE